jgi:hypothetical protein
MRAGALPFKKSSVLSNTPDAHPMDRKTRVCCRLESGDYWRSECPLPARSYQTLVGAFGPLLPVTVVFPLHLGF